MTAPDPAAPRPCQRFESNPHAPISCRQCGQEQRFHPDPAAPRPEARLVDPLTPIVERYACQRCGRRDGLDAILTDDEWERITGWRWNILCLWCMDELALAAGVSTGVALYFAGRALHGVMEHAQAEAIGVAARATERQAEATVRALEERIRAVEQLPEKWLEMRRRGIEYADRYGSDDHNKSYELGKANGRGFCADDLDAILRPLSRPTDATP